MSLHYFEPLQGPGTYGVFSGILVDHFEFPGRLDGICKDITTPSRCVQRQVNEITGILHVPSHVDCGHSVTHAIYNQLPK